MRKLMINKKNPFLGMFVIWAILGMLFIVFTHCSSQNKNDEKSNSQRDSLSTGKDIANTELKFLNKWMNFGKVPQDTLLSADFHFVNTGNNKLFFNYINPDCNCTGYNLSKDTIMPDDTGYINLQFNTKGKYGNQKIYTIVSVNTKSELYKLTLTANVNDSL